MKLGENDYQSFIKIGKYVEFVLVDNFERVSSFYSDFIFYDNFFREAMILRLHIHIFASFSDSFYKRNG